MTLYFNACDVTVSDTNYKNVLCFFDLHLCFPALKKVPPYHDSNCINRNPRFALALKILSHIALLKSEK